MLSITLHCFEFGELPPDIQKIVMENNQGINIPDLWWGQIYADAERVGLHLFQFDDELYARGEFAKPALEVANAIMAGHLDQELLSKTEEFLTKHNVLITEQCQHEADLLSVRDQDWADVIFNDVTRIRDHNLKIEFLYGVLSFYNSQLQKEYENRTSETAIIETLKSRWFTKDGKSLKL